MLVLTLAALCLAAALPAAAGAHVRPGRKAEYKVELGKMQSLFAGFVRDFTATQASIEATATTMRAMLDDPARSTELTALEERAADAGRTMTDETMPDDWMTVRNAFSAYLGNASRWFVSSRDRVRFTGAATSMERSFGLLVQDAFEAQALQLEALGHDPPDMKVQDAQAARAAALATKARRAQSKDVKALLALQ